MSPKFINCMGFTHLANLCTHVLYVVCFDYTISKMGNMRSKVVKLLKYISILYTHQREKL